MKAAHPWLRRVAFGIASSILAVALPAGALPAVERVAGATELPVAVTLALVLVLGVAIWSALLVVLATAGGWRRIAQRYPAQGEPAGERFGAQSAAFGRVSYSACLTIHRSQRGLRIAVWPVFRIGHPPLFIPWHAIHAVRPRRRWRHQTVVFDVGSPRLATVELAKVAFEGRGR